LVGILKIDLEKSRRLQKITPTIISFTGKFSPKRHTEPSWDTFGSPSWMYRAMMWTVGFSGRLKSALLCGICGKAPGTAAPFGDDIDPQNRSLNF
jgi:hypothetical protein